MDISKAALPARYGHCSKQDQKHPLFPIYDRYRASMSAKLVDSSDFRDWLYQYERNEYEQTFIKHPRFKEFQNWMRDTQAGLRKCTAADFCFPKNFAYWLEGGRW